MHSLWNALNRISLIKQIIVGLVIGIAVAMAFPAAGKELALLGVIFVGALKGIAPVLVFVLVAAALGRKQEDHESNIKDVIILYLIGTFLAAFFAVMISFVFPLTLQLDVSAASNKAPEGIAEVLTTLLKNIVDNPVHALMTGNYIGILGWACLFGVAVRRVSESSKAVLDDCADAVTTCVQWIIRLAPLGIMGLVADSVSSNGIGALIGYAKLLCLLLGTMLLFAFVINPIIVYAKIRRNPYPLVWKCVKTSGVTAFFTRSSAANIPVNLSLAKELGVNPDTYTGHHSARCDHQYVRRSHYHFHHDPGCRPHPGHFRRLPDGSLAQRTFGHRCLWCFRCCRRLAAADPHGLQPLRYLQ